MSLAFQGYTQVAQQLQMAEAKVQESKPAFTVVEPAVVPLKPSNIGKLMLSLIFLLFSVVVLIVKELFVAEYLTKDTSNNKNY